MPRLKGQKNKCNVRTGDIVIYKYTKENVQLHHDHPCWFPKIGTVGMVVSTIENRIYVQWEDDTTSLNDCWYVFFEQIKKKNYRRIVRKQRA